jgi:GAF domain-containing protein
MGDSIATYLRRLIPSSLCLVFAYDSSRNELDCLRAFGAEAARARDSRIQLGQPISDWLRANRDAKINSPLFLNLKLADGDGGLAPFRSCLSVPFFVDGRLSGVFTMYSSEFDGFTEEHLRIVDGVSKELLQTTNKSAKLAIIGARQQA